MIKRSFKGGVHPLSRTHEGKQLTRNKAAEVFEPEFVTIPMNLHLGAPSEPCVKKGDIVKERQVIANPVGFLGLPIHASVSGEVVSVAEKQQLGPKKVMCITIKNDKLHTLEEPMEPIGTCETADPKRIVQRIKEAGICGMGGAAFPLHVKLTIQDEKYADTIILNGAECETHLTSDFRTMLERSDDIVAGLRAIMRAMNCENGVIAIEDNKPEAIEAMKKAAEGKPGVRVVELKTKYPQGSEKQLITVTTGREVPRGKLPIDCHVIVTNVATAAAVKSAVEDNRPLIRRVTTVTGKVKTPMNLLVPIGTSVHDMIEYCGGYDGEVAKLVAGGMMTGPAAPTDDFNITKAMGGVVALDAKEAEACEEGPCIRCGRCVSVCPIGLNPSRIKQYCDANNMEGAKNNNVMDCIVCGCCSFTCPAHRYLTASFKNMKDRITLASRLGGKK
ncbi:MAG: electron transport complex subunit RsxC [Clostridia bacterium]|nr:electron transport complex subunit RsxC [Clostridia bacterium]MBR4635407.1 electron transport complex subunit RsxC [Clostridia bacterium]